MKTIKGQVEKIHIIKMSNCPLVYFKLSGYNCLIAKHSLSFIADVTEGTNLVIYGYLNAKNQFVCKKYAVIGKTQILIEFEQSKYPHRMRY